MRSPLFRRSLVLALAAVAVALPACDRKSEGIVEVFAIGGPPRLVEGRSGRMDPSNSTLAVNVAQGLVRFDARGLIEPGLAETWNVSDDGLSYIFRLANTRWPDGREVTAEQVARLLKRQIAPSSRNSLEDTFGAVEDVVAMTDRVLEIRLSQPRPHLLQLLAQPEMALISRGQGTGPFAIDPARTRNGRLRLTRDVPVADEEESERELVQLSGASASDAVAAFADGKADLVIGGTFDSLPVVRDSKISRGALRFDPAIGLFGLVPSKKTALLADPAVRQLLSAAIDRQALVETLAVPGLVPRATVLEPGLETMPDPQPPGWLQLPMADRRPGLEAAARQLLPQNRRPVLTIALPDGAGSTVLFDRLSKDWGALGIDVQRVANAKGADFKLIDQVAPSTSAAWYLRHFRCEVATACDEKVDELIEAARNTTVLAQRSALLAEAAARIDSLNLYMPLAAPIRWSLVSPRVSGFAGNRFAIHTLTGLEEKLERNRE